ncbi:MAG: isoamylase early set domain-containing protein [Gemmatimonadota bacterium]|nr:isoamylase early set domain-containing protein [Gemmatimonadota bacterium]
MIGNMVDTMDDERDEVIARVVGALSPFPQPRSAAVARVLMAVRARRAQPVSRLRRAIWWAEDTAVSAKAAGLLAAASLAIGFVARGTMTQQATFGGAESASIEMQPVASVSSAVPVAMAFELANAKTVSVVGDFNGWDPAANPMQRVGANGPWSTTLLAKPGRHTYAFLVDGTTLVADPRASKAKNPDFGGDASVLMVRTP